MNLLPTDIDGLLLIEPQVFADERGSFFESWHATRYREIGMSQPFVQMNCSRSQRAVLRGLHFQKKHPQGKLVGVTRGEVYDVAVDLRSGSRTFGKWFAAILNDKNRHQLYIPPGFAHGFYVLSETADFVYLCTNYYSPNDEGGVIWNDSDLGIPWPERNPILSEKDRAFPTFRSLNVQDLPILS